jgi:hypothetical protein
MADKKTLFIPMPRWLLAASAVMGTVIPFSPLNKELFENIYRPKDIIVAGSMRMADEKPEDIFRRHIYAW